MIDMHDHPQAPLAAIRDLLGYIRTMRNVQRQLLETLMAQNDDITSAEDALDTLLDTLIADYVADGKLITDLQAQLAAGPPGLTADQGNAILARLVASQTKVQAALTAAAPSAPTPPVIPAPATTAKPS